jgi:hypothetical protein
VRGRPSPTRAALKRARASLAVLARPRLDAASTARASPGSPEPVSGRAAVSCPRPAPVVATCPPERPPGASSPSRVESRRDGPRRRGSARRLRAAVGRRDGRRRGDRAVEPRRRAPGGVVAEDRRDATTGPPILPAEVGPRSILDVADLADPLPRGRVLARQVEAPLPGRARARPARRPRARRRGGPGPGRSATSRTRAALPRPRRSAGGRSTPGRGRGSFRLAPFSAGTRGSAAWRWLRRQGRARPT